MGDGYHGEEEWTSDHPQGRPRNLPLLPRERVPEPEYGELRADRGDVGSARSDARLREAGEYRAEARRRVAEEVVRDVVESSRPRHRNDRFCSILHDPVDLVDQ